MSGKRVGMVGGALALFAVACTSLLGDFQVGPPTTDGVDAAQEAAPTVDGGGTPDVSEPQSDADVDSATSCSATQKTCSGNCVSLTDPGYGCANAASCTACTFAHASPSCKAGACALDTCAAGWADCANGPSDGCETNTNTDPAHCGTCTHVCSVAGGTPNCSGGQCSSIACTPPNADCDTNPADGCEVNLDTDVNNCGACKHVCGNANGVPACNTTCSFACTAPYKHCTNVDADGCSTNTSNDDNNCGGCNNKCAAGQHCKNSVCTCDATSCANGCCDAANVCRTVTVGACGAGGAQCVDCGLKIQHATAACTNGACDYTACIGGYADADGVRSNGCESTLPTGVPESANLVLWLAGEDYNANGWLDRTAAHRDALPYNGSPAVSTLNGHNVVNFNGGQLLISAGFPNWAGLTIFIVSNTSTDDSIISMGVSYNPSCSTTPPAGAPGCVPYDELAFGQGMSLQQCDPGVGSCYQAYAPTVTLNTWQRVSAWENPALNPSYHSFFNGVDNGALNHNLNYPYPPPWATPRKDAVLGWRNYRGMVAEIIVFNAPLADTSRVAVDTYLATKWKVP